MILDHPRIYSGVCQLPPQNQIIQTKPTKSTALYSLRFHARLLDEAWNLKAFPAV